MKKKCVIVGGGIIGMMTALELSRRQWDCTIIDKGECGKESSWAGGGILSPLYPWHEHDAIYDLVVYGQNYYPQLSQQILIDTGIDIECLPSGMLYFQPEHLSMAVSWLEKRGVQFEQQDTLYDATKVPSIFLSKTMQIRPPRLNRGVKQFLLQQGITIIEHDPVIRINNTNSKLKSIETLNRIIETDTVVIACGSWANEVLKPLGYHIDIKPVKGQIIAIQAEPDFLPSMMMHQSCYLIPRKDGLVLAGSTVEDQGFDKTTSENVKLELLESACKMVPKLKNFPVTHHWAGLRPGTSRPTPYICRLPDIEGVYLNTGHFRCGLTLAPASSHLLSDLMEENPSKFDVASYQY